MAATQLPLSDYQRYGRQMILDGIGLEGQLKLKAASVVVVGAGGLGCPALQYLAAAGVGKLGIVDHDVVELSNLQRQILHSDERIGIPKAESAAQSVKQINPGCTVVTHICALTSQNALDILADYDIILDCTDNSPTRYLLSDSAVKLGKPLVSGAAQKFEGQLCIYNLGENGPCYRCLFPKPPSPEMTGSCAELGILGAVTGIIGNLQALETIKLITGLHDGKPTLLLFSALSSPPFRTIKIRPRRPACAACGKEGERIGNIAETDYVAFCGGPRPDWLVLGSQEGNPDYRLKAKDLQQILQSGEKPVLIDVRPPTEFGICHLPQSRNVPLAEFVANPQEFISEAEHETYFICRLGNDSQIAADALRSVMKDGTVKDLVGGLRAWAVDVDPNFPIY
ncbi:adenylyltransferase and sulfurtransferase [Phanerochaete sordida]|uniref:Needs CLA4 to survive protein 3 n=1 Tax=Phanerochaete sordida TaxID=48140 RepID=A0A9P3L955_9APHY|nr:adenylyltransferase and sulfurtransferase [Phanerochaete sordida]